jgi:aminotransferase
MIEEAAAAMRAGQNQYLVPAGDALLRQRIAGTLGTPTDPDTELTITVGAAEGLCLALLATVDPGDEVILFTPGFERFTSTAELFGAKPVFVPVQAPGWHHDPADLAAAFTARTRAIILNTPGNPTGRVLTRRELEEIAELCRRWDVTVICDEVYREFVYDGRAHLSVTDVPGLAERSIVVGSLSKSHAVSGWRLGYVRADRERTEAIRRVHELTTNGAAAPLQVAAGKAAQSADLALAASEMERRRDLAQDIFSRFGMKFAPVEGGCFLLGDISPLAGAGQDCTAFVRELLDTTGVLLMPAAPLFAGDDRGKHYVRIAFNRRIETLREAERRLFGA